MNAPVHIAGAGPAGLAAAITIAKGGGRAIVHERKSCVGARFHGDFQGQENWSTRGDVLALFQDCGIEADFPRAPFHALTMYDPAGHCFNFRAAQPLFYLVRRGNGPDTLDTTLLAQAEAAGVEIRFNDAIGALPAGGICATGPRSGQMIAAGYQFETDMADGAWAALSEALAPKGYAYLLVHEGQATLACYLYDDFQRSRHYLQQTAAFFERTLDFRMPKTAMRFGGLGNVTYPTQARIGNTLYVGEAAGFQDALWGFGMRYAMVSGHLAGRAWLEGRIHDYDRMWRQTLGGPLRASIVNRWLFSRLGDRGYTRLLRRIAMAQDVRQWLHRYYREQWTDRLLFPLARRALNRQHVGPEQRAADYQDEYPNRSAPT